MKKYILESFKYIIIFIIAISLFFIFLLASYFLPKERIETNIKKSIVTIQNEGLYYHPFYYKNHNFYSMNTLDNYTDSLLLNVALDKNHQSSIFKKAVLNLHYWGESNQVDNLVKLANDDVSSSAEYIRYWFGSEPILKILLVFNDYMEIRYLNVIMISTLVVIAAYLISKKIDFKYTISFILSLLFMNLIIIPMSLQFSPVMYIMLISVISLLLLYDKRRTYIPYLFFITGCVTAYFDLLTYPLITLGYPLVIVLLLLMKENNANLKKEIAFLFKLALLWGVAYACTYIAKWAIASVVLNKNCFELALNQLAFRMNIDDNETINKLHVIKENFVIYFNKYNVLIITMILMGLVGMLKYYKTNKLKLRTVFYFLIVSILPYIWYILLSNHSHIHHWMTFRIQGITLFALLSLLLSVFDFKNRKTKIKKEVK